MDPLELRTQIRAGLDADPDRQARAQRIAARYRRHHPAPAPATTSAQQWADFAAAEAATEREHERNRR